MGKKAQEKRAALGEAYIGKHGINKIRGAAKGRHNHDRLEKINAKQTYGSTLTQARARKKLLAPDKEQKQPQQTAEVRPDAREHTTSSSDALGEQVLSYIHRSSK